MGRQTKQPEISSVTEADLEALGRPRAKQAPVSRLRDSHHMLARMIVAGWSDRRISETSGYSRNRISILRSSPAFQELLAQKRQIVDEAFAAGIDTFVELHTQAGLMAIRQVVDQLEDADEEGVALPLGRLMPVVESFADRFGYGRRATQVNLNVDFAAQLDRAIKRSGLARPVLVEPLGPGAAGAALETRPQVPSPVGDAPRPRQLELIRRRL